MLTPLWFSHKSSTVRYQLTGFRFIYVEMQIIVTSFQTVHNKSKNYILLNLFAQESNVNMDGPSSQFSDNGSHEHLEQMHPGNESRLARGFQIPRSCHNRRWQVMFGQFRDRITERCEDDVIVDEDLFSFNDSVLSSNDAIQDSVMLRNPQVGLENIETQEDLSLGANECTRLINGSQSC